MKRHAAALLILLFAVLAGCDMPLLNAGFSHKPDGGGAGQTCPPGEYVVRSDRWDGPVLLKKGLNNGEVPPCPDPPASGGESWEGYADLVPPPACAPCLCAPSTGRCELSSTLTAHDVPCQDLAQSHKDFSFDAPPAWSGQCDSSAQIPAGVAKSVTIEPIAATQESCTPLVSVLGHPRARSLPHSAWKTFARSCRGWNWQPTENPETFCIPTDQSVPDGFRLCITHDDIRMCSNDDWPDQYIFYDDADDNRECLDCYCGPPVGGMCTAAISINKDATCSDPVKQGIAINSAMSTCINVNPPGQALVSKSATTPNYIPGTCETGRIEVKGTITKTGAVTFCCQR